MIKIARILCPVDFSESSQHAFAYAIAIARWYGSRVTALHVLVNWPAVNAIPSLYPAVSQPMALGNLREELLAHTTRFVEQAHAPDVQTDAAVEEAPDVHREILAQAAARAADLIVMGSHGRSGFDRFVLGSVTDKILRKAEPPVLIVPHHVQTTPAAAPVHFRRILCPVDFSAGSIGALKFAASLAEEADAHVTLLHVVEPLPELYQPPMAAAIDVDAIRSSLQADQLERLQTLVPEPARTHSSVETAASTGRVSRDILRRASELASDLIVMGVQGRGAIDRMFFGSNTQDVIRGATCPVLTVRASP
jgi:nucleotide-binding universal stress UspA family protein